jgi:Sel1 repeat
MYLDGNGGLKDPKQAARWLSLAAGKGQYEAQALLGELLLNGEYVPRQTARGLMYLSLARDGAPRGESWIRDRYTLALKQATAEECHLKADSNSRCSNTFPSRDEAHSYSRGVDRPILADSAG